MSNRFSIIMILHIGTNNTTNTTNSIIFKYVIVLYAIDDFYFSHIFCIHFYFQLSFSLQKTVICLFRIYIFFSQYHVLAAYLVVCVCFFFTTFLFLQTRSVSENRNTPKQLCSIKFHLCKQIRNPPYNFAVYVFRFPSEKKKNTHTHHMIMKTGIWN